MFIYEHKVVDTRRERRIKKVKWYEKRRRGWGEEWMLNFCEWKPKFESLCQEIPLSLLTVSWAFEFYVHFRNIILYEIHFVIGHHWRRERGNSKEGVIWKKLTRELEWNVSRVCSPILVVYRVGKTREGICEVKIVESKISLTELHDVHLASLAGTRWRHFPCFSLRRHVHGKKSSL